MPRRYLTGGGKDLKNRNNSNDYLSKNFKNLKYFANKFLKKIRNLNKILTFGVYDRIGGAGPRTQDESGTGILCNISAFIKKVIAVSKRKPSDGCNSKKIPDAMLRCLSDRCTHNTASRCHLVNENLIFDIYDKIGGTKPRAQASPGASVFGLFIYQTVYRKIEKIVSDAKRKPLNRCTRNTASSCHLVNEKLTFAAYDRIGGAEPRSTQVSYNRKPNAIVFLGKLRLRAANCGSILIEFAVCMPILIILLFYIHDLVKIKRYYSQTEFVAQQMANIIQNISQKRENRKITTNDLRYAVTLAYQTIYPGTTMFWQGNGLPLVHVPHPIIYYVKGNDDGTATTVWAKAFWTNRETAISPTTIQSATQTTTHDLSHINMGTNLTPSQIYPTLKIKQGEVKIIVEAIIFFHSNFKDINGKSGYTPREVFGCHLISPKRWHDNELLNDENRGSYFHSVVIFTPKPGLFDETAPR